MANGYKFNRRRARSAPELVNGVEDYLYDNFLSLDPARWTTLQTGAGQTVTVAGATGGARYLNVAMGTTINAETIIESKEVFDLPVELGFALSMSQRIANNSVFVELVGVDLNAAVETDTTIPSTLVNDARNAVGVLFDSTTATNAKMFVRSSGASDYTSGALTTTTTAATGTTPNFLAAALFELIADFDEITLNSRPVDSVAAATPVIKRTSTLVDAGKRYKVRLRFRNGGTAPASNTDVRLHMIRVLDFTRLQADISRHLGSLNASDSLAVAFAATPSININRTDVTTVAGGMVSNSRIVSAAASTNATVAKSSVGRVYKAMAYNAAAALRYLKFYNKATAPTVGTDTPVLTIPLPPGQRTEVDFGQIGFSFATGIGYALTTNAADNDTVALVAGDVVGLNVIYS